MGYPPGMAGPYPTKNPANPGIQMVQEPFDGSKNAYLTRFNALVSPELRDMYKLVAEQAGMRINPDSGLTSLVLTAQTEISYVSTANPGIPVSLDAAVPQQTSLRIYAENPVFIRRVTAVLTTVVFRPGAISGFMGPPPVPPFEPQMLSAYAPAMRPEDFVYMQIRRPGMGQMFQDNYVAVSQFCGDAGAPYFWSPIPVLGRGGQILIDVTLMPPGQQGQGMTPPFIDRVGFLQFCFHCERFEPFGT